MSKTVYLAGPITGQSYKGATGWREKVHEPFRFNNIKTLSPMRGKAYLSEFDVLEDTYEDKTMSSIVGINVRDYNDVKTCDALLVNFTGAERVSIGTVMEIAWARAFQKPVVIVKDKIHDHGMLTYGNILVNDIEEGVRAVIQLIGGEV